MGLGGLTVGGQTRKSRPAEAGRTYRLGMTALIAGLVAVLIVELWATWLLLPLIPSLIGHDFTTYRDAAETWLRTGEFYRPYQLAGPYNVVSREILYPPVALVLFVPFTVLPGFLWWAIPVGITAAVVISWRPRPWAIALILALLVLPLTSLIFSATLDIVFNGNPAMWACAAVALATRFPAFGPFALLKPVPLLLPFALIGVRSRAWWIGGGLFALLCVALLPMWADYVRVLANARSSGVGYAASSVFPLLIPIVAWIGQSKGDTWTSSSWCSSSGSRSA